MSFKQFTIILESYTDAKNTWLKTGKKPEFIDTTIKRFKALKDQKKLREVGKNDIGYWIKIGPEKLNTYLDEIESVKSKKEKVVEGTKNIINVFDNDDVWIGVPKTFDASCVLAKGKTKWCIASTEGVTEFPKYTHYWGLTPYYVFFKKDGKKFAIMVRPDGTVKSVWNMENQDITKYKDDEEGDKVVSLEATEPYKRLKDLGIDINFKPLLKPSARTAKENITPEKLQNVVKKIEDEGKAKLSLSGPAKELLKQFLMKHFSTTELTDKYIVRVTEPKGKKILAGKLTNLFNADIERNNIKSAGLLGVEKYLLEFIKKFVHEFGAKTVYNW